MTDSHENETTGYCLVQKLNSRNEKFRKCMANSEKIFDVERGTQSEVSFLFFHF